MHRQVCITILVAMLATTTLCRPMTDLASERHQTLKKSPAAPQMSRRDLLATLPHDQLMSQLLSQLNAELSNAEQHLHPMHDRDYNGWMDFGRRSSEDALQDS
ncbi:gastrin/cholecystokinin-like peptide [Discoglossus pictus]